MSSFQKKSIRNAADLVPVVNNNIIADVKKKLKVESKGNAN